MNPFTGNPVPLTEAPPRFLAYADPSNPAELSRCSYLALWRRVRDGKIASQRIGNGLFIDGGEVETIARGVLRLTGQPNARAPKVTRPRAGKATVQPSSASVAA